MHSQLQDASPIRRDSIDHVCATPPVEVPPGYVGELVIPGTGRRVWWTGRVAIGLLHQPTLRFGASAQSSLWIQDLMLGKGRAGGALAGVRL